VFEIDAFLNTKAAAFRKKRALVDNLTIVVLGDAEKIKSGLEEIGVVTQTN